MTIFNTFFMGGFECADHINRSGTRVNLLKETGHDLRVSEDYRNLAQLGIKTVREGICWSMVEATPYHYDFTTVKKMLDTAKVFGIQQIWDLCHFGYPDGLFPTHPHFCQRFTALCEAFATFHKNNSNMPLFVVPINEISFLSWHSGDVRGTVPFAINSGFDMKYHLCKAAILGIEKLREVLSDCSILMVEPLIDVHCTCDADWDQIAKLNEEQFQAMDIIAGRMCPELGGSESLVDILGFNYYWNCQWKNGMGPLEWPETEITSRTSLSSLLEKAWRRYQKPMFLSETGHFGCGREAWIAEITHEALKVLEKGIDFHGICIYPVTDRPDWDALESYSHCGIWDLDGEKNRIPHHSFIRTIRQCQMNVERVTFNTASSP